METEYDSASRPPRALEELLDLAAHGPLVLALVERDLKVRYKRSMFGVLWTMANPAITLLVLSLALSSAFAAHTPGYPFFVVPGLLLWNLFSQTTTIVAREASVGADLWRRVRIPRSALVVATLTSGMINLLLALALLLPVIVVSGRPVGWPLLTLPLTLAAAGLFVLGVSLTLGAIAVHFPDVADIYGLLLPALMFAAPIAYPSAIVSPAIRPWLQLNPITLYVEAIRAPLYQNAAPSLAAAAAAGAVAVVAAGVGWLLFTRATDDLPYRI